MEKKISLILRDFGRAKGPPTSPPACGGRYRHTKNRRIQVNLMRLFRMSVENKRFELLTPCLQSKCSTN